MGSKMERKVCCGVSGPNYQRMHVYTGVTGLHERVFNEGFSQQVWL